MDITIHDEPITDFLSNQADNRGSATPTMNPPGICILSGGTAQRNLQDSLAESEIAGRSLAGFSRIDEVALALLRAEPNASSRQLPDRFRIRLLGEILREATEGEYSDRLRDFASDILWSHDETLEELDNEFNEYLRCTDAGNDHDELLEIADSVEDTFIQERVQPRLDIFQELLDLIEEKVTVAPHDLHPSRSHVISSAREQIAGHWDEEYGHVEWVAISTINEFDNPILRFLLEIGQTEAGPDLHFFLENGTRSSQAGRFESIEEVDEVRVTGTFDGESQVVSSEPAQMILGSAVGEEVSVCDNLDFTAAPDRRREIERLVDHIRTDLREGTDPQDILIVAPEVDSYRSQISDIFETNGIPFHIESQKLFAHLPVYRFLQSTLDLLAAVERGEELRYWNVTDPLRLGFCRPGSQTGGWPLDARVFLYLEQQLERAEPDDRNFTFDEWHAEIQDAVDEGRGWGHAWQLLGRFSAWISDTHDDGPPTTGQHLQGRLETLLRTYMYQTIPVKQDSPHGPGVDTTRPNMTQRHQTSYARKILARSSGVANHYTYALDILEETASWEEAALALREVVGANKFSEPNNDGQAISIIDADRAHFRSAEQLYFLGMSAGEFPREAGSPVFLPRALREAVTEAQLGGENPYLHLASSAIRFNTDLNALQAALSTSTHGIHLFHRYKDSEGRTIEWSPFLDLLDADGNEERIRADEWLSESSDGSNWDRVARTATEKDRLRLLFHHSSRRFPNTTPPIERSDLIDLAEITDMEPFDEAVMPRYDRYARPPIEVLVTDGEAAFRSGPSLSSVVGGPQRPHEVDLFSQCQLKYYYYQLLFNYDGDTVKDDIPVYVSYRPDYRLGTFPKIIRHNYSDPGYKDAWRALITDLLSDRQEDLSEFDSPEELREWYRDQDIYEEWHERPLFPVLENEWQLVQEELMSNPEVNREWEWQESSHLEIEDSELIIPAHRRDRFPDADDYTLPIFFIRHSPYGERAIKECYEGDGYRNERCGGLCQGCSNYRDCHYPVKYTLDHRIHGIYMESELEGTDVVGVQFQERYEDTPSGRQGYLKDTYQDAVRGSMTDGPEGQFGDYPLSSQAWYTKGGSWEDDISEVLEEMSPGSDLDEISYQANMDNVRDHQCETCVYRDMCMIPHAEGG